MITLVAMSPSGEVFFTRDAHSIVWRHRPLGSHEPVEVNQHTVDWVVHRYDYTEVNQEFDSWAAASACVDAVVPRTMVLPEDLPVGPTIAASAVRVMENWLNFRC